MEGVDRASLNMTKKKADLYGVKEEVDILKKKTMKFGLICNYYDSNNYFGVLHSVDMNNWDIPDQILILLKKFYAYKTKPFPTGFHTCEDTVFDRLELGPKVSTHTRAFLPPDARTMAKGFFFPAQNDMLANMTETFQQ